MHASLLALCGGVAFLSYTEVDLPSCFVRSFRSAADPSLSSLGTLQQCGGGCVLHRCCIDPANINSIKKMVILQKPAF